MQGKLPQLWAVFKDKQVLKREIPASVLLFGDWMVYLWAVQNGRVLECSLGYYIQPLVVFALGAVIFKEKMSWRHLVIIAIVVVGIVLSTSGFGGIPYVTIALALMFAVYAAIKKSLTIDSIVSTTSEILMMVPVALLFILFFRMGDNGMGSMTILKQVLMIGGGVITGLPMVFYSIGVRNLPLMTTGYASISARPFPSSAARSWVRPLTHEKLVSFLFIWAGVILYVRQHILRGKAAQKGLYKVKNRAHGRTKRPPFQRVNTPILSFRGAPQGTCCFAARSDVGIRPLLFAFRRPLFFQQRKKRGKEAPPKTTFLDFLARLHMVLSCKNKPRERCAVEISPKCCIVSASRSAAAFALKCRSTNSYRG